jgi:N-acetylneuraminic acid mutarotase
MAIDSDKQMLYVFGGRIVNGQAESELMNFSGFYRYNLGTDQWEHIL